MDSRYFNIVERNIRIYLFFYSEFNITGVFSLLIYLIEN